MLFFIETFFHFTYLFFKQFLFKTYFFSIGYQRLETLQALISGTASKKDRFIALRLVTTLDLHNMFHKILRILSNIKKKSLKLNLLVCLLETNYNIPEMTWNNGHSLITCLLDILSRFWHLLTLNDLETNSKRIIS